MREIEQSYNFNDPVVATEIFRVTDPQGKTLEYGGKIAFGWEDVKAIESYPYPDNWETYKGPKYYVQLAGFTSQKLILGDQDSIVNLWALFRNTYPLFRKDNEEPGEDY